eukprot:794093_1
MSNECSTPLSEYGVSSPLNRLRMARDQRQDGEDCPRPSARAFASQHTRVNIPSDLIPDGYKVVICQPLSTMAAYMIVRDSAMCNLPNFPSGRTIVRDFHEPAKESLEDDELHVLFLVADDVVEEMVGALFSSLADVKKCLSILKEAPAHRMIFRNGQRIGGLSNVVGTGHAGELGSHSIDTDSVAGSELLMSSDSSPLEQHVRDFGSLGRGKRVTQSQSPSSSSVVVQSQVTLELIDSLGQVTYQVAGASPDIKHAVWNRKMTHAKYPLHLLINHLVSVPGLLPEEIESFSKLRIATTSTLVGILCNQLPRRLLHMFLDAIETPLTAPSSDSSAIRRFVFREVLPHIGCLPYVRVAEEQRKFTHAGLIRDFSEDDTSKVQLAHDILATMDRSEFEK